MVIISLLSPHAYGKLSRILFFKETLGGYFLAT